jgi:2-dehydro-3-deoxyphosphogalactonate aldolase
MDRAVVEQALQQGLESLPGVMTATEAFAALAAGARQLKLFPASSLGAAHLRALRDVLPGDARVWAVGGAGSANLRDWVTAGAAGIGVGAALFTPGTNTATLTERARELVNAWLHATNQRDNN